MIRIRLNAVSHQAALQAAVRVLKCGGVIAFPTETTYGLGCDPRNAKAVKKIFQIKGRSESKPLQLIAGSLAQVQQLALLTSIEKRILARYWPGPLTLLVALRSGKKLVKHVSPKRVIGIRVSSSDIARQLALAFGHPIATTSANRSGSPPAFSGRGVIRAFSSFPDQPSLLLDIGSLPRRKPSTVARIQADGSVDIFRQGSVRI